VLQLRHVLFRGSFFGEIPRQHELGFEHGAGRFDPAVKRRRHPPMDRVKHLPLHLNHHLSGVVFVPTSVEGLGHGAELNQEIPRSVFWLDLATLLTPQAEQGGFIVAHDDPGIGAANEGAAVMVA
jgi:hypothetical protein